MSTKGRSTPRVVCCAIPIARAAGKVLVITSRKRPNSWVCEYLLPSPFNLGIFAHSALFFKVPKGGWESTDVALEAAASREAWEEGRILCPSSCPTPS
jgi:diphosphoinositol-polyphosphate diphosphatase